MTGHEHSHLRVIALVQGAARALAAQLEDELPGLPWAEDLRAAVAEDLEAGIGLAVAGTCERLVLAGVTPGVSFPDEEAA